MLEVFHLLTQHSKLMRSEQIFSLVTFLDKRHDKCPLFWAILTLSYVRRWVKLIPLKSPKTDLWKKHIFKFAYLEEYFTDRRTQGVNSKFMHILLVSKSIFAIEQKAIVSCFVKNAALLLGHPVYKAWLANLW